MKPQYRRCLKNLFRLSTDQHKSVYLLCLLLRREDGNERPMNNDGWTVGPQKLDNGW